MKTRHGSRAFDGEGARLHGGRWNSPGRPAVYTSETRALAMLEVLAGLGGTGQLPSYVLIDISFGEALVEDVASPLPSGWDARPPGHVSQGIGDAWLARDSSAILRVPSVVVPTEHNYVLNPAHPDFARIMIGSPQPMVVDPRLRP